MHKRLGGTKQYTTIPEVKPCRRGPLSSLGLFRQQVHANEDPTSG